MLYWHLSSFSGPDVEQDTDFGLTFEKHPDFWSRI